MTSLPLTSLITLLIGLLMLALGINVGRARGKYGIQAPAVTGHELFERAYRIQMNKLESAAPLLPALWLFAGFISDRGAAAVGAVCLVARIGYALAYQADPAKRGPAFAPIAQRVGDPSGQFVRARHLVVPGGALLQKCRNAFLGVGEQ